MRTIVITAILFAAAGLFLVPRFFAALAVLLLGYQTIVAVLFAFASLLSEALVRARAHRAQPGQQPESF